MFNKINKLDNKIIEYVEKKFYSEKMDFLMKIITFLGDYGLIWLSLILYLLLKNYNIQARAVICSLIITIFINELILKNCFKRARPAHINNYEHIIVNIPKSFSFPSGHTATAFSVIPIILLGCSAIVSTICIVSAILIGFSRVYIKVHYMSDVIVGAVLGTSISIITFINIVL